MDVVRERAKHSASPDREAYRFFLGSLPLFCEFTPDALTQVLAHAYVKTYPKRHLLFLTGDKAECLYIVIRGLVKLFRETHDGHESVLAVLTERDVFALQSVLVMGELPCCAEVVADEATLMMIPASFIHYMAECHGEFDHLLGKLLESALEENNRQAIELEHLVCMTSAQRVACFLLRCAGVPRTGSVTYALPYEKALAAGRLGMTPETFSRSLAQLKAYGVESHGSEITIGDMAALRAFACEHCSAMHQDCPFCEDDRTGNA